MKHYFGLLSGTPDPLSLASVKPHPRVKINIKAMDPKPVVLNKEKSMFKA